MFKLCYHFSVGGIVDNVSGLSIKIIESGNCRAEEYFRRSVKAKPEDAEALSRYADFLWLVRKKKLEAEAKYLEAMDADPFNCHHRSKYVSFLWNNPAQPDPNRFPPSQNSDEFDPVS